MSETKNVDKFIEICDNLELEYKKIFLDSGLIKTNLFEIVRVSKINRSDNLYMEINYKFKLGEEIIEGITIIKHSEKLGKDRDEFEYMIIQKTIEQISKRITNIIINQIGRNF